jgi:cytochrome c
MSKSPKIIGCAGVLLILTAVWIISPIGAPRFSLVEPSIAADNNQLAGSAARQNIETLAALNDVGRIALGDEIAAWNIDIRPDGTGLPSGRGSVATGEELFAEVCAGCHGDFGEGVDRWPVLAGGYDSLTSERPVKTIGSYWPYLSTVWDYINRAMPFGDARSLSDDDVYALTAYLLYVNDIVEEEFELNSENFTEFNLENQNNFYADDRATTELINFSADVCMQNCKSNVEIVMRARVLDVTPDENSATSPTVESGKAEVSTTVAAAVAPPALDPALVTTGKKIFKKCKACHAVGDGAKNKVGPHLNDLDGRLAGTLDGFKYSKAIRAAGVAGLIWNDETLAKFLAKPKAFLKGTKMSFSGLKKPGDIEAVTAYLKSFEQ